MEMENKNNKIKALCDYLLGYWQFEIDEDARDKEFNDYFTYKYGVNFYKYGDSLDQELNISYDSYWKGAHIELSNLLDDNNELKILLLGMVNSLSSRNKQNMKRTNLLLEELYKKS